MMRSASISFAYAVTAWEGSPTRKVCVQKGYLFEIASVRLVRAFLWFRCSESIKSYRPAVMKLNIVSVGCTYTNTTDAPNDSAISTAYSAVPRERAVKSTATTILRISGHVRVIVSGDVKVFIGLLPA